MSLRSLLSAHDAQNMLVAFARMPEVDQALDQRQLGERQLEPWFMLPAWFTVPCALLLAGVLCWYFVRLGNPDVPRVLRWLRRIGIVCALAAIGPLVRAVSFVHPHEDRVGWATAWSLALLPLAAWFVLALVDVVFVLRGGLREYTDLRREVFGRRDARHPSDESGSQRAGGERD